MGNILSLSVWSGARLREGRMAKYMSLLAVADMCTLISGLCIRVLPDLFSVDLHDINVFSCYFQYYFLGLFSCISAWILVVMTVERFIVIAFPLVSSRYLKRCKASALIGLVVLLGAFANIPLVLINSWDVGGRCRTKESWEDVVLLVIFTLYSPVPLLFLLILNLAIIAKMNRFSQQIEKSPHSQRCTARNSRSNSLASANSSNLTLNLHSDRRRANGVSKAAQSTDTLALPTPTLSVDNQPCFNSYRDISFSSKLPSISECSTPDDESGIFAIKLPDVVTENLRLPQENDMISVSNSFCRSEATADSLSSASECANRKHNSETTLSAIHRSGQQSRFASGTFPGRMHFLQVDDALTHSFTRLRSQSSPDIIRAHSTQRLVLVRRGSHPPTACSSMRPSLVKRPSSLSLMFDQLKAKSEQLAEMYNQIKNKRTAAMLLAVTLSYFLLTTPYTITVYTLVYMSNASPHLQSGYSQTQLNIFRIQHVLELLLCLNHSINVLLYCATGSKFRKEFKAMFSCRYNGAKNAETQSDNEGSL